MSTIIGLGRAGCNVAKEISKYPQYNVFCIDSVKQEHNKFKLIEKQKSFEDYEANFPSIKKFLKGAKAPYTVIVGGSGTISGCVLHLMQQLQSNEISVLYIKPETDILSNMAAKQERIVFHILQQYARSNMIDKMFIVSNSECENILGGLTIKDYFNKINSLIATTFHMYNVFQNIEPLVQTKTDPLDVCKIATFGIVNEEGDENLLYDLRFPREKHFYYSVTTDSLENDTSLMKNIKSQIRGKMTDKLKVSYSVFENNYDQNYIYSCTFASMIQEENYDFPLDDRN
tara:strand:- start:379 stop:1239 length:861 start_codon:yes stop_codon:yes gene_type:complete